MFSFLRRLGVSVVAAKLVLRIKMNRSDCFSLNCSQGWVGSDDNEDEVEKRIRMWMELMIMACC